MSTLQARSGPEEIQAPPKGRLPSKILIVDDSETSLQALRALLEREGQVVLSARSAREALDRLHREDVAVVLLDVRMPEMDGFEMAAEIRNSPRLQSLPIIFVTGTDPETSDLTRAYQLGAVDFIQKPIHPEALQSKVATFVELFRSRQELERRVRERTAQLEQANDELSDFFENGAIGCHSVGPDGTILRINETELRMLGYRRDEVLGHTISEFHADAEVISDILRRLHQQEILHDFPAQLRTKSGRLLDVLINSSVLWKAGEFVHTRCFTRDVTPSRRAERSLRFLAEASRVLGSSLDYETTIQRVADLAVGVLADWCVVDIARAGTIRRVATAHRDPEKVAWAKEFQKRHPVDPQAPRGVPQVLRTGQAELYPEITEAMLRSGAKDEEHYRELQQAGMTSVMLVPLRVHGEAIGVLTFISTRADRRYDATDLASAEALAERAALAVENARLYEERTRQKEYFGLLAEASRLFAESHLDLPQLMNRLCELLVPSLADSCYVRRFSEDRQSILTIAVRHRDPELEAHERAVTASPQPAGEGMTGELLRTGRSVFLPVVDPEAFRQATAPQYRSITNHSGLGSYLMVPMRAQGKVVGALGLGRQIGRAAFTQEELEVAQKLADRVGLALATWDAFQWIRREGLRLEQALSAARMFAWEMDLGTGRTTYSDLAGEILGIPVPELGDRDPLRSGTPEEDRASLNVEIERISTRGGSFHLETPYSRPRDGARLWLSTHALAHADPQGRIVTIHGVTSDITDLRNASEALREAKEQEHSRAEEIRTVLESTPAIIWVAHDPECRVVTGNPAANAFLQMEEGSNQSFTAPNRGELRFRIQDSEGRELRGEDLPIQRAARGVDQRGIDLRFVFEDGRKKVLYGNASPLLGPEGKPRGAIGAFVDVTERRRAESEVRALNATLETRVEERTAQYRDALSELNTFAYTVAHDLRAPLRAMNGFSQILLSEYSASLGEAGADFAQRISTASRRMDLLITDLLAYSRLTREAIPLQTLDLGAAVGAALEQVSSQIEESHAVIQVDEPLPLVIGHPLTVAQAVANLLSNAVKFVKPGIIPRVHVRSEIRGPRVRLWIEDNGIGISPNHHDRLFRVFERLHSQDAYPGTGIGLAIVRRGVERMGGQAGLEPSPAGSRFWIELPLPDAPRPPRSGPS